MKERVEMLLSCIEANVAPILVDFISGADLEDAIILPANAGIGELNGHYEGTDYVAPDWYKDIVSSNKAKLLVIDRIDTIPKSEQLKFGEILEYRKVSTFELPKNCVIIITAKEINKGTISEELFSLVSCA